VTGQPTPPRRDWHPRGDHVVAIILAIGMVVAINLFTLAAVYSAIVTNQSLSENATQILTGWGGGVIGVIGAIVGYTAGHNEAKNEAKSKPPESDDP
jgi:hypothetical protein